MYLILFCVGSGFVLISILVGQFGEFGDFGSSTSLAFFKPALIATFLVACGGLGMMLTPHFNMAGGRGIVLFLSVCAGLVTAGLMNRFVIIPLKKVQNTSAFHKQDTIGIVAEVVSPIPQDGFGKISYNISGSVVTSPAKSEDGSPIPNGENVEIIYIEKNTYFVRRQNNAARSEKLNNERQQ